MSLSGNSPPPPGEAIVYSQYSYIVYSGGYFCIWPFDLIDLCFLRVRVRVSRLSTCFVICFIIWLLYASLYHFGFGWKSIWQCMVKLCYMLTLYALLAYANRLSICFVYRSEKESTTDGGCCQNRSHVCLPTTQKTTHLWGCSWWGRTTVDRTVTACWGHGRPRWLSAIAARSPGNRPWCIVFVIVTACL